MKVFRATPASIALMAVALLGAACSKSSDTTASPSPLRSAIEAPAPASPTGTVVNDCKIEPKAQCPGASLTMVSLAGMDLSGANLEGADLHTSDLRKLDLTGANLVDANIMESDLTEAQLVGADLTGAKLKNANLTRTDFTGATVTTGQLSSAYLCGTVMPNGGKNNSGCTVPTEQPTAGSSASPTSGPDITSFVPPAGSPPCPSSPPDASVTVKIRYKVSGADSVTFLMDGVNAGGSFKATGGTAELDFSCNKPSHRVTIQATGSGKKVRQSATIFRT